MELGIWIALKADINVHVKEIKDLLFVDNTVLVADSKEKLHQMELDFKRMCQGKRFTINPPKSEVMKMSTKSNVYDFQSWFSILVFNLEWESIAETTIFRVSEG